MVMKVTVGVCGGVAAYRAVELVRALQEAGLDPHVVMTAAAEKFVTPLTFAAISGHRVITSLWSGAEVPTDEQGAETRSSVEHIEEAQTTAVLVVVPATADVIGKMANGLADDFLTTMYLAMDKPVVVAPAMNVVMWNHLAVQTNVATLKRRGVRFVEPGAGYLACGMEGAGRLAQLSEIVAAVLDAVTPAQEMAGETVLVTAGGTREAIDAVRFLGNRSSGKMGYALAAEAVRRGAKVILVSTTNALPVPSDVELYAVETAEEMRAKVLELLPEATVVLKAAAVADFRPARVVKGKLHREGRMTLELEATEDIVAEVVRRKNPGTTVVAFAAEVENALERGRSKLVRKGVDAIVVNDISHPGLGFDSDRNAGTMLIGEREVEIPAMSKREMAAKVLDEVMLMRHG
jgi:phosphopantothenoylcysteine decarboxylase/phosphopantothenate--cysteine ligase